MQKTNKIPVVIVGMEINGLGVARALSADKIPAIAIAGPAWNPCCQTNTCDIVYCSSWSSEALTQDLKLLGERLSGKAPLIITKDEPVLWISEHRKELEKFYEINLPEHQVVELLMNKGKFHELCVQEEWPVPFTLKINNKEELASQMKNIIYPCILKPQLKNSEFRKHAPEKAYKIDNQLQLLSIYNNVAQWEPEVVIQEWIEGGDDRIAYCLAYYNQQGMPVVHYAGRKIRQWPVRCGGTALAEPAPKEWINNLVNLTDEIFKKVGFKGLGSIEYKMRQDNSPVIMEPTVGRTNYQSEIAVANGVNIPAIAYHDLTKQKYSRAFVFRSRPVKLIDGKHEAKSALIYWRGGELKLRQWIQDRSGKKKYMLFRTNDPGPFMASVRLTICAFARVVGKKIVTMLFPTVARSRQAKAVKR